MTIADAAERDPFERLGDCSVYVIVDELSEKLCKVGDLSRDKTPLGTIGGEIAFVSEEMKHCMRKMMFGSKTWKHERFLFSGATTVYICECFLARWEEGFADSLIRDRRSFVAVTFARC